MRLNVWKFVCVVVALIAMANLSLAQQTSATFAGIVTDPSGAVLPGAEVQLINEGTNAALQQLTTEAGEFVFTFVPVGTYTLKLGMPGFKAFSSTGIPLGAAQSVRRTYILEVGSITDSVSVTGEAPMVNTLSPEQRFSVETLEVKNLPMANRNITNILDQASGLTRGDPTTNGQGGTRFRLNGLGGSAMRVTADGADANGNGSSPTIGGFGGYNKIDIMSAEAVAEVQVVKGVMPAEYGSAMGGNMSLITKSGTNAFHGSLFHRYEGSVLGARQPFLRVKPNSVWNQFGGSFGGPIKKDKLFFFTAVEAYRQRTTIALPVPPTVPTPLFRNILLTSLPRAEATALLRYYPLPNQPYAADALLGIWNGPGIKQNDDDHLDFKVDYMVGGGNLSVTFAGGHPFQIQAPLQPLNPQITNGTSKRWSGNYVIGRGASTWSSRFGLNKQSAERIDKYWYERDPNRAEKTPASRMIPSISYPGMTGLNRENKTWGLIPAYMFEQQISILKGAHTWKTGALLSLPGGGQPDTDGGSVTFQTLQDVQNNEPATVAFQINKPPYKWRMVNFGMFLQDDWRVNQKLVLNLGVRYDRYGHFVAKQWEGADIPEFRDPTKAETRLGFTTKEAIIWPPTGAIMANLDGLLDPVNFTWGALRPADNPFESDNMSLAPRFGFAYTVDNRGDFVVRGGFAINFTGFDASTYEEQVQQTALLPRSRSFTRAEAVAYNLKYPTYNEDLTALALVLGGGKPQVAQRMNPDMRPPYAMNYTLGIQKALGSTLVLETAYVGTRGVKFNLSRTYNRLDRITGIRPNPTDIQGSYIDNSQQTAYHSWQTTLKQRMTRGLLFTANYTWGKGLSYTGGDISPGFIGDTRGSIEDFDQVKIERSPSTGDITHNIAVDFVYQVPTLFGNSVVGGQVLGGWQVAAIWKGQTGIPLAITQTGGRPDTLDIKGAVNSDCCGFGNLQYLNAAAFRTVEVGRASNLTVRRGSTGAASLRGPGMTNLDLSLGKSFQITEGKSLELKSDLQNVLNQTEYRDVSTNLANINFGQVVGARPARAIQVQLRLAF